MTPKNTPLNLNIYSLIFKRIFLNFLQIYENIITLHYSEYYISGLFKVIVIINIKQ